MNEGSIGRRYAKALLDLAREAGRIDAYGDQLSRFWTVAQGDGGPFLSVMSNPGFHEVERRNLLGAVLERAHLDPTVGNFLRLLNDKGRFSYLGDIVRAYRDLADQEANRLRATVTTATEIPYELAVQVKNALEGATGKKVVLETKVDPRLIGGMVAQVGGRVFDASLRTRLESLQLQLSQNIQA